MRSVLFRTDKWLEAVKRILIYIPNTVAVMSSGQLGPSVYSSKREQGENRIKYVFSLIINTEQIEGVDL